jgi:thiol-disulfide isomerase/thioredoxin
MALDAVKNCQKCNVEKTAHDNFLWVKTRWHSWCNDCRKIEKRKWYLKNQESEKLRGKEFYKTYYPENKEKITARTIEWQRNNKEKYAAKSRRHYENNKDKAFANSAKRRAAKRNACPVWFDKTMQQQIEQIYANARKISEETGVAHEVDHIIPLVNSAVCGLHVPWNLQILTQFKNRSKRNNLENING